MFHGQSMTAARRAWCRRLGLAGVVVAQAVATATATAAAAQGGPPPDRHRAGDAADPREQAVRAHAQAIEAIGMRPPEASLRALEAGHFAGPLFSGAARESLLASMAELRRVIAAAGSVELDARGGRFVLGFRGENNADVVFALEERAPYRITEFVIDTAPAVVARPRAAALRWEALAPALDEAEREGFSGVVVALRRGVPVLARGYGRADPQRGAPPTVDTVYDIGSMPIDFTRAAILWLAQTGRVALDDPIGEHLAGVPADKAGITLGQLMDGRSGLANFHFRDTDVDKDLGWIDRDTALRRIFEQPLLFAPGSGSSHSHSAFGLLAAVVENVSGQAYGDFLRHTLFGPAGMTRTGFYGESLGLPDSAFAVGAGQAASTPNIPPRWGRPSWLVIGSGGMVASVGDMRRAFEYIATGRLLRGPWLQRYRAAHLGIGGSDRGFLFLRITADDGSAVYLASHSQRPPADSEPLVQALIGMVLPDRGR